MNKYIQNYKKQILSNLMYIIFSLCLIYLLYVSLNFNILEPSISQEDILNKEKLEQDRDLKKNVILIIVFIIMIYIKLKSGGGDSSDIDITS